MLSTKSDFPQQERRVFPSTLSRGAAEFSLSVISAEPVVRARLGSWQDPASVLAWANRAAFLVETRVAASKASDIIFVACHGVVARGGRFVSIE